MEVEFFWPLIHQAIPEDRGLRSTFSSQETLSKFSCSFKTLSFLGQVSMSLKMSQILFQF